MKTLYVKHSGIFGEHAAEIFIPTLFFCSSSKELPAHGFVQYEAHHIPFSTLTCRAGILLLCWRQGPVSTFFHLWSTFRTGSGAQTLAWPAESNSLALESGKGESTEGVRGWVGSEDGRARVLEEEELQQQLGLLVLCGCSHNGVQSSEPSYTPTPRAVWQNRLCEGGLEDWAYKDSRATFFSFYATANLCPKRKKKS